MADGDILQCMDPLKQLCEGTKYGVPGPWSMEQCVGNKKSALNYCSMLPCFVDGGSYWQCRCNYWDAGCTALRDPIYCAISKCCQAQTDDEGREACRYREWVNYKDEETSIFINEEEMISRAVLL